MGECDGHAFMVSQYMRGGEFRGVIRRVRSEDRPLPLGTVVRYGSEISDALIYAHDKGIVHRDIQPGNVWLDEPDGAAHVGDFDLALTPDAPAALADPNAVVRTRAYMPLEEARGDSVDARGDLY